MGYFAYATCCFAGIWIVCLAQVLKNIIESKRYQRDNARFCPCWRCLLADNNSLVSNEHSVQPLHAVLQTGYSLSRL